MQQTKAGVDAPQRALYERGMKNRRAGQGRRKVGRFLERVTFTEDNTPQQVCAGMETSKQLALARSPILPPANIKPLNR